MPVELFNKETFEKALPNKKDGSGPAWLYGGFDKGEHTYLLPLGEKGDLPAQILIRSSIDSTGWSRATGEDSIRVMVVDKYGKPLSGKFNRHTTRLPGWGDRMMQIVRFMAEMAVKIGECPNCKKDLTRLAKVKKPGPNKGRWFISCRACNDHFKWLSKDNDEEEIPPCPGCNCDSLASFIVKKEGPNKGRPFLKCGKTDCNYFQWTDED